MSPNTVEPILIMEQQVRAYKGMVFGQRQSTLVIFFRVKPLPTLNFFSLDDFMSEWSIKPHSPPPQGTGDMATDLLRRVHYWQATLQKEHNIPVFGECLIIRNDEPPEESGTRKYKMAISFSHSTASILVLRWILDALNSFMLNAEEPAISKLRISSSFDKLAADLRPFAVPGTNAMHFLAAAYALEMWWHQLQGVTYQIGIGSNSRWLSSSITDKTPGLGLTFAKNKLVTALVLSKYCLPVPRHSMVNNEENAVAVAEQLGYPVVIKPADRDQGVGVFAGLRDERSLRIAYRAAKEVSNTLLVEKHYHGEDYRFTVMDDRVIKIMHRKPAHIIGNGKQTVAQLVNHLQASEDHRRALRRTGKARLELDAEALELLEEQGLMPGSIPAMDQIAPLRRKSNISSGGSHVLLAVEEAHPDNCTLALRAAHILGLDLAGVDLIMPDARKSWLETGAVICEVNGQPQIGYRDTPEIYKDILRELVPGVGRLPVHLLLTAGQLEQHVVDSARKLAGTLGCNSYSTATGIWINGQLQGWHPENSYSAAQALLLSKNMHAALLSLDAKDIVAFGLPIAEFSTVNLLKGVGAQANAENPPELEEAMYLLRVHANALNKNHRRDA